MSNFQCPGKNEIHVWRASLDLPASDLVQLQATLTADEIKRAARFYFEKDRAHYIAGRGLVRAILGRYLNLDPAEIRFLYGRYGKPELDNSMRRPDIFFNVAHSRGLALIAIATERKVGVDLEYIRRGVEIESIAARFFAPSENAVIRALTGDQQREAFYKCWTRKEAVLKARGDGMTCPLDQIEVSVAPGVPAALVRTHDDQAACWSLQELAVDAGYVATVAAEGKGWKLEIGDWMLDVGVTIQFPISNI